VKISELGDEAGVIANIVVEIPGLPGRLISRDSLAVFPSTYRNLRLQKLHHRGDGLARRLVYEKMHMLGMTTYPNMQN
jgi:hypothetical protein